MTVCGIQSLVDKVHLKYSYDLWPAPIKPRNLDEFKKISLWFVDYKNPAIIKRYP